MARTKEFDENEVLDQAVELFRKHGFQATSFSELTTQLKVNRQSLYDTWGDKQTFFHAVLTRYREKAYDYARRVLAAAGAALPQFEQLFAGNLNSSCGAGSYGCLMVNSMVEQAPHDALMRAAALSHARSMEGLFAERIARAQREGDVPPDKDPVKLGRYLFHSMLGISVAARALGDRDTLTSTVQLCLQSLR